MNTQQQDKQARLEYELKRLLSEHNLAAIYAMLEQLQHSDDTYQRVLGSGHHYRGAGSVKP